MFMKSPDYYTYKQHTYQCKNCGWQGLGLDLRNGEMFDALYELDCPSCFEMVTFVPYPSSREPHGENLSESGRSMIDSAKSYIARFNAMCLKSPDQLPDVAAAAFSITWDYLHKDELTILKHGDKVIFCEPALYEGYERYEEVALILKERYGDALIDLVPTGRSEFYLYGDRLSSPERLNKFRQALFNLPTGA
jgi:hypothetical protein